MSDRTYLEAWQQAHREAGADMDRVICERDEARAERDALAAQLEAARAIAVSVREAIDGAEWTRTDQETVCLIDLLAPVEPLPEPPRDREPQPSDGPDYHADHAAWRERNPAPLPEPEQT